MSRDASTHGADPASVAKRRRTWRAKFHDAFRGLKLGIRGHSSFFVHFFFAAAVIAAAVSLDMNLFEWCILLGCITGVITAELFNSAIETICRLLDVEKLAGGKAPLDIASAAVLAAAIGSAIIGTILFSARLLSVFGDRLVH